LVSHPQWKPSKLGHSQDKPPLGLNYKGYKIIPSDKIYYGDYMYKIHFIGNSVHRDIKEHDALSRFLRDDWLQDIYTNKNRVIYFRTIKQLDPVLDQFPHLIDTIHGPVDQTHVDYLTEPWAKNFSIEYRNKLWFNKYDTKIDIYSNRTGQEQDDIETVAFIDFINENLIGHHWYLTTGPKYWSQNFLYCSSEELAEIKPWLSMLYTDIVSKINSAVIYSTDK